MTAHRNRLMRPLLLSSVLCLLLTPSVLAKSAKPLRLYFIDVEGGQSTLVVSPFGQSVLIDTGWPGTRDADRIAAVVHAAGLKQIDYLLITHYHQDHVGGVPDLLQRIKVGTFVDHGTNYEDSTQARENYERYEKAIAHSNRMQLKAGEGLALKGIAFHLLTVAGEHLPEPLPGAGEANPYCGSEQNVPVDASENSQSIGVLVTDGKFRFLDMGDLTEKKELELMCPNNFVGTVDLFLTTHHGVAPDNPKALVWAIRPLVAILNNGAHKGGSPAAWQIVHDSPGLVDLWQLHYAVEAGKDHNVAENFIANTGEKSDGHYLEVTAQADGRFKVENSRNGYSRKYSRK